MSDFGENMDASPTQTPMTAMTLTLAEIQRQLAEMSTRLDVTARRTETIERRVEAPMMQQQQQPIPQQTLPHVPQQTAPHLHAQATNPATASLTAQQQADLSLDLRNIFDESSRPKINHPKPFSGKKGDNIGEFINKCNKVFIYDARRYATEGAKIAFASNLLEDKAYEWIEAYEELPEKDKPAFLDSWLAFKAELKRKFTTVDIREASRLELMQIITTGQTGDVASYALDVDRVCARLSEYPDIVRRDLFFYGLKKSIRREMLSPSEFASYQDLVERATKFDRQVHQYNGGSANESAQHSAPADDGSSPMEIDATQTKRPKLANSNSNKLSATDKQALFDKGLCFTCRGSGHIARDCPKKKKKSFAKSVAAIVDDDSSDDTSRAGN
jgi:hypothetical protein